MRAYLVAIVLLLIILGAIGGQFYRNVNAMMQSGGPPPPSVIEVATATSASWFQQLSAVGTVRARQNITLSSEVGGTVTELHFTSGQTVKKGDLLLTLNDSAERANLKQQQANVKLARLQFERDAKLLKTRSVSQTQYDQTKAALDAAQARLQQAKSQLDKKHVRAPFDGTTGISDIDLGDYIDTGTVITQLDNLSALEVNFSVPTRYYRQLKVGQPVTVIADKDDTAVTAHITVINSRSDERTGSLTLRAKLPKDTPLIPGLFVRLSINLGQAQEQVQVPETAITYSLHGNTVYIIENDNEGTLRAQPKVVKTGSSRNGQIVVLSGLSVGQQVASAGQNKLYAGAAVRIADSSEASQP